jgi:L-2-hydroxyglutarate oxidase LhgO
VAAGLEPAKYDVVVIGAGLVGLATALALLERRPDLRLAVVDKEHEVALHQSGRNSGVVHAGLYYAPRSLKASLCREGREALLRYADEHGIPYRVTGKLVVALDESELPRLEQLEQRGVGNGLVGLRKLGPEEFQEHEPHVRGVRALHVPETAIIDFREVARAYAADLRARGGGLLLGREVTGLDRRRGGWRVLAGGGELAARRLVICAGVHGDRLAARAGRPAAGYRIAPFRGDYFTLTREAAALVRGLVYPVPDPGFPFLGVHFTRRMDGAVWAGPNAVPALAREGYRRRSVNARDAWQLLSYPGLWRLARRYWRTAVAEIWRDTVKRAALRDMQRYVPELGLGDISFGPCGIRAQALARDGALADDFLLDEADGALLVLNAPSPAATSSLAIGRRLAQQLLTNI